METGELVAEFRYDLMRAVSAVVINDEYMSVFSAKYCEDRTNQAFNVIFFIEGWHYDSPHGKLNSREYCAVLRVE
jgi:hypothetical protein